MNSLNFSVNGEREYGNSIQLDGIESTTNRTQDITVTPSVDSIQEFKVSTSSFNAEFGHAGGGIISVQTKAGTNRIHGTLYEFYRPQFPGCGGICVWTSHSFHPAAEQLRRNNRWSYPQGQVLPVPLV